MPAHQQFYFEDVTVGDVLETPAITLTETHATLYRGIAQETDGDPSVIPDLLPLCLSTGLGWRVPQPPLAVIAFLSIDWEMVRPARVGDTIHSRSTTLSKRAIREGGVVVEARDIFDQRGDVVQRGRFTFLVSKRPA